MILCFVSNDIATVLPFTDSTPVEEAETEVKQTNISF